MASTTTSAFISYSREDSEFALRLAKDLKAAGARVWLDQLDIAPGYTWDNAIENALIASPLVLMILSPESSKSTNVRNELHFALEQGKIVIPVLYKDCIVPLQLQRNQRIDFRVDYARGLNFLLGHLQVAQPNAEVLDEAAKLDQQRRMVDKARQEHAERISNITEQAAPAGQQWTPPPVNQPSSGATPVWAPPGAVYTPPQTTGMPGTDLLTSSKQEKVWAALSYVTFLPALLFLIAAPYKTRRFVRFHAWQSVLLNVVGFLAFFIAAINTTLYEIVCLGLFIAWLIAIIKASKGARFGLPGLGKMSDKLAG